MAKIELINPENYEKNLVFNSSKSKDEIMEILSKSSVELNELFCIENEDSHYIIPTRILFSHIIKITESEPVS